MGRRVACDFARLRWRVGIAARREDRLKEIKDMYPANVEYMTIDVAAPDAAERFNRLIELIDGMDYLLYAAGCGWQNPSLDSRTRRADHRHQRARLHAHHQRSISLLQSHRQPSQRAYRRHHVCRRHKKASAFPPHTALPSAISGHTSRRSTSWRTSSTSMSR